MTQSLTKVPVRKVRGKVPSLKNDGEIYVFTAEAIRFFDNYTQTMDEAQAFEAAGIESRRRSEFLNNPYVQGEMDKIQQAWSLSHRMKAGYAVGEHHRLMQKFEKSFDSSSGKVQAGYAGTLAKMSEASLKATGVIGADNAPTVPNVVINLDMGGPAPVVIDAKVADDAK
jgi:hypothetical protein